MVRNWVKAAEWFLKAAEHGSAEDQANIGAYFAAGLGVPQDSVRAIFWYNRAAEQGIPRATLFPDLDDLD